ncbi:MAG: hypothetical protein M1837_004314 [Sclerophora amabilis]|nr:MAG: hypothetical protein M1837_004314 [Sclerophora amabilis]
MRSSVWVSAMMAALAVATPLDKRVYVTDVSVVTTVVVVTAGGQPPAAPTPPPSPVARPKPQNKGHKGHKHFVPPPPPPPVEEVNPPPPVEEPAVEEVNPPPVDTPKSEPEPEPVADDEYGLGNGPPDANDWRGNVEYSHNIHRKNHTSGPIQWDQKLADIAQEIADSCVYEHNTKAGGGGYGQNIAAGAPPQDIRSVISNQFYNDEIEMYLNGDTNFEAWGHATQVLWAATTKVGCAIKECTGGLANTSGNMQPFFTVCNYGPPGNMDGAYEENVKDPQGDPVYAPDRSYA